MGHREGFDLFEAEVVSVKGECGAGHSPGQTLKLSCWETGGLCGFFYHDAFPSLHTLQFGGRIPWQGEGELTLVCPDSQNQVVLRVRRR